MKIAIIDIGSNNIKLEIHSILENQNTDLIYEDKSRAQLGYEVFKTQKLNIQSQDKALECLKRFKTIIDNFKCDESVALGTAALREGKVQDFIDKVKSQAHIDIKIISGAEEARLVYLGTLNYIAYNKSNFFLIDIGGGSTEVSISNQESMIFAHSFMLGTVRLRDAFGSSFNLMQSYIKKIVKPFLNQTKSLSYDKGICTGGTAKTIVSLLRYNFKDDLEELNGIPILTRKALKKLLKKILVMEMSSIQNLEPERQDIILPGIILLLQFFKIFNIKEAFVIPQGLRDGALVDIIMKKTNSKIYESKQRSIRRYSLHKIHEKFNLEKNHAQQCAYLVAEIYKVLQQYNPIDIDFVNLEDIIYGVGLLHDIGTFISYEHHHKHSEYLIMNADLVGFSVKEKTLIALIVRYHRKGFPKDKHKNYYNLNHKEKQFVLFISGILRVADALDRGYKNKVKKISLKNDNSKSINFMIESKSDISLELWSVENKKKLLESYLTKKLIFNPTSNYHV